MPIVFITKFALGGTHRVFRWTNDPSDDAAFFEYMSSGQVRDWDNDYPSDADGEQQDPSGFTARLTSPSSRLLTVTTKEQAEARESGGVTASGPNYAHTARLVALRSS